MTASKTTNYLRILGFLMVLAAVAFALLVVGGFGNEDACIDAGGRWGGETCDGATGFVPLAQRPRTWVSIAPTLVLGLALLFIAKKRTRPATPR